MIKVTTILLSGMRIMANELDVIKGRKIVIYGAGTVADFFFYYLCQNGYEKNIDAFVLTKLVGDNVKKFGKPVYEFESYFGKQRDCVIFIAAQKKIQKEIEEIVKRKKGIEYYSVDAKTIVDEFYEKLNKQPINRYKILGQNQCVSGYGDNPKYIFEELHRKDRDNKLDLVWSVSEYDSEIPQYVRQVIYGSYEYYEELTTSHIWIDNERKPNLIRKRDGQVYIQAWHGAAPIKKVEADAISSLEDFYIEGAKHDSEMADLFISGSEFYTELYRKSFWYNGEILKSGLPRQDVFWNTHNIRKKIYSKYQISEDVWTVLYAPTFRSDYHEGCYDLNLDGVIETLKAKFGRDFKMLVSRHPVNHISYNFNSCVEYIEVGWQQDFEEILAAVDVLITDYSGCMYDFSYTERPIFLFQTDYEEYIKDRDFYIPMDELPYITSKSNRELIDNIKAFDEVAYKEHLRGFMQKMGNYDNGTASKQVVDYILDHYMRGEV